MEKVIYWIAHSFRQSGVRFVSVTMTTKKWHHYWACSLKVLSHCSSSHKMSQKLQSIICRPVEELPESKSKVILVKIFQTKDFWTFFMSSTVCISLWQTHYFLPFLHLNKMKFRRQQRQERNMFVIWNIFIIIKFCWFCTFSPIEVFHVSKNAEAILRPLSMPVELSIPAQEQPEVCKMWKL